MTTKFLSSILVTTSLCCFSAIGCSDDKKKDDPPPVVKKTNEAGTTGTGSQGTGTQGTSGTQGSSTSGDRPGAGPATGSGASTAEGFIHDTLAGETYETCSNTSTKSYKETFTFESSAKSYSYTQKKFSSLNCSGSGSASISEKGTFAVEASRLTNAWTLTFTPTTGSAFTYLARPEGSKLILANIGKDEQAEDLFVGAPLYSKN